MLLFLYKMSSYVCKMWFVHDCCSLALLGFASVKYVMAYSQHKRNAWDLIFTVHPHLVATEAEGE